MKNVTQPTPNRVQLLAAGVWLMFVFAGLIVLTDYSNTAAEPMASDSPLPDDLDSKRVSGRHTLFMFVHPRCPCSRASISELARLMAVCHKGLDAHVYFLQPAGKPNDWSHTDLWVSASRIFGVSVAQDVGGRHARDLHASTSGEILLYDTKGQFVFRGGITTARGHEGDNIGRVAIENTVNHNRRERSAAPVFGCPLFDQQLAQCNLAAGIQQ